MTAICLYLQASSKDFAETYEPVSDYRTIFRNERFLLEKPKELYQQTNQLLLEWLYYYPEFHINLSLSAGLLEQLLEFKLSATSFRQLNKHSRVDYLAGIHQCPKTNGYSPEEFNQEVREYLNLVKNSVGARPRVFYTKCLQFSNQTARELASLDMVGLVNPQSDLASYWRHPDFVYQSKHEDIKILIQNQSLSEELVRLLELNDPTLAEDFLEHLRDSGEVINLFVEYDQLLNGKGFFEEFLCLVEESEDIEFARSRQILRQQEAVGELDAPSMFISGVGKRIFSSALSLFNWLG